MSDRGALWSSCFFLQLNVNADQGELYEETVLDEGHPITGIYVEEDGKIEYVMSSRKVCMSSTSK